LHQKSGESPQIVGRRMVTSNISPMKDTFGAKSHKPFLKAAIDNKPVLMPACVGAPLRALREGQPRREAGERKATGLSVGEVAGLPNSGVRWRTSAD
jgi:hypothetical protein